MTRPEDLNYHIDGRQHIAETDDLRVQILSLEPGEEIPWHYHTVVTDTFICLEGPTIVNTRSPDAKYELAVGEAFEVPPHTAHQVMPETGSRCRFVIVQGIGPHDYIPVGPADCH